MQDQEERRRKLPDSVLHHHQELCVGGQRNSSWNRSRKRSKNEARRYKEASSCDGRCKTFTTRQERRGGKHLTGKPLWEKMYSVSDNARRGEGA